MTGDVAAPCRVRCNAVAAINPAAARAAHPEELPVGRALHDEEVHVARARERVLAELRRADELACEEDISARVNGETTRLVMAFATG